MKINSCVVFLAAVACGFGTATTALCQAKEDPAHEELRTLMKEMKEAHNAGDLDKLVSYLDENVIVTWQNAKVNQGPKEVKAYYVEMTQGPNRRVQKSTIQPEAAALSFLYNDAKTAIAWGNSKDHYLLTDGTEFDQDTRWSATVVKKEGRWKVASIHISTDMFDNPILHMAMRRTAIWTGAAAAGVGLILGLLIGVVLWRRKTLNNPP